MSFAVEMRARVSLCARMTHVCSLGILSTHPIQYHSGWFRALAAVPDWTFMCITVTKRARRNKLRLVLVSSLIGMFRC